jgi:two-component system chemotaxis response regulator CheB
MAIKVLIVDDSALMRALLTEIISGAEDLEVVGAAPDPIAAREMIKALNPDVLTLDVEMPRMDGLEFLDRLMRLRPMPVIMISSFTAAGSEVTLRALELGAVDYLAKPQAGNLAVLQAYADEIRDKIRAAAGARLKASARNAVVPAPTLAPAVANFSPRLLNEMVIGIGASTGGTEAIKDVLAALPAQMPPIVMVQHMPETFTPSFAKRLDSLSKLTVIEAQGGERLKPGMAYLAPGHSHLRVRRSAAGYVLELGQDEPVNRHRPAADVLFSFTGGTPRQARPGHHPHRHGQGRRAGPAGDAPRRRLEHRPGTRPAAWSMACRARAALAGALDEVAPLNAIAAAVLARLKALDTR